MANAVNLIDGLDGLAAGIVAIASGTFLLYGLRLVQEGVIDESNPGPMWAGRGAGRVRGGLLPHNLHPAQVFMGDGGGAAAGRADGGGDGERGRALDGGVQRPRRSSSTRRY